VSFGKNLEEVIMISCTECKKNPAAEAIGICVNCLRLKNEEQLSFNIHAKIRQEFELPSYPPKSVNGIRCHQCSNNCRIGKRAIGYCGMRINQDGKLKNKAPRESALVYTYLDPIPTNCCAAWFCSGSHQHGYNLSVFFYGCNFDCLFCQNSSHKLISEASIITEDEMVASALDERVRCVCFFGGSPEPQLPFALGVARRIMDESNHQKKICWEWNGCGNSLLVKKATQCSAESDGTVKFDLKAFHQNIVRALCGVDNRQAFHNFKLLARQYPDRELLTATTLLVPYYVDRYEVESIAAFISECDRDIPYSLLVFRPNFFMRDMPITPRQQVEECYQAARKYLKRVHIGNRHLMLFA
jgi:pyruvate formate lyase activating enzyme